MNTMSTPSPLLNAEDLHKLLDHSSKCLYKAKDVDAISESIMSHCLDLIHKDYKTTVVSNINGELCSQYPSQIPVMEYALIDGTNSNEKVESMYENGQLKDLFTKARFARCRARFVIPVILYEGKHICRSGTISGGVEIYGRSGFDLFFSGGESVPAEEPEVDAGTTEWQLFNRLRGQDIRLLKELNVKYIIDLMMEKKKVKFGMNVTSSEKVDKQNRYGEFTICSLPYPGCEFFKEWKDNSYLGEGLVFDWSQGYVDTCLDIPPDGIASKVPVDWNVYKSWDLVVITRNYLKLLLEYIREGDRGILVHCISGWDRTPLFISLLRLSLWADNVIHKSLSAIEILYLTIAYDWFLFGHNLPDRNMKGEEIFFFCFTFLKFITADEFSIHRKRVRVMSGPTDSDTNLQQMAEDDVLLEPDTFNNHIAPHNPHRDSNTSLSSNGSSVLNESFTREDVSGTTPTSTSQSQSQSRKSPAQSISALRISSAHSESGGRHSNHVTIESGTGNGSSPMAVPIPTIRRHPGDQAKSCSSSGGSWQIISGTGSLRGTTSGSSSFSSAHSCCLYHETADMHEETSTRRQRLESVRRIFHGMYCASMGFGNEAEVGGISSLLDHFAEKVGFRSRMGTT